MIFLFQVESKVFTRTRVCSFGFLFPTYSMACACFASVYIPSKFIFDMFRLDFIQYIDFI